MQIVQNLQNTWVNLQWQTARLFSEFEDSQWHPFALSFLNNPAMGGPFKLLVAKRTEVLI